MVWVFFDVFTIMAEELWGCIGEVFSCVIVLTFVVLYSTYRFGFGPGRRTSTIPLAIRHCSHLRDECLAANSFSTLRRVGASCPVRAQALVRGVLRLNAVASTGVDGHFLVFCRSSALRSLVTSTRTVCTGVSSVGRRLGGSFNHLRS